MGQKGKFNSCGTLAEGDTFPTETSVDPISRTGAPFKMSPNEA